MSCAMIYWGNNYDKFYDVFINYGAVVDIRNLKEEKIGKERRNKQRSLFEMANKRMNAD